MCLSGVHHKKGQGLAATPGLTKDRKVEEVDQVKKERCASGVNDLHKKASSKKRKLCIYAYVRVHVRENVCM
jgi:hypothetical protein